MRTSCSLGVLCSCASLLKIRAWATAIIGFAGAFIACRHSPMNHSFRGVSLPELCLSGRHSLRSCSERSAWRRRKSSDVVLRRDIRAVLAESRPAISIQRGAADSTPSSRQSQAVAQAEALDRRELSSRRGERRACYALPPVGQGQFEPYDMPDHSGIARLIGNPAATRRAVDGACARPAR